MIRRLPRDLEAGEAPWFQAASGAKCPPPDLLIAVRSGVAPEEVAATVREHVAECDACRLLSDVLMDEAATTPTADEADRIQRRVEASAARPAAWRYAAAAAVLLVVVGVLVLRLGSRTGPPASTATATPRPVPGPPQPPAASAFALALAAPTLLLPESALVLRGGQEDPYAAALAAALEPYGRGEYATAADRLRAVARRYPRQPHAAFYLGASELMLGDAEQAAPQLAEAERLARDEPWLSEEAAWYRAVALERVGRPAVAAEVLAPLCSGHGARREVACAGARELARRSGTKDGGQGASEPDRGRGGPSADSGTDRSGARPAPHP